MRTIKFILGIATIWLAGLSSSVQAYLVDWNAPYAGSQIQGFSLGKTGWTSLVPYRWDIGWNRCIEMWQAVRIEVAASGQVVRGISFHLMHATGKGTIDLNVYEGVGVGGRLVSSTKLQWASNHGESWYAFKLTTPVQLNQSFYYTFSFENMMEGQGGGSLGFALGEGGMPNPPLAPKAFDAPFLQYDFASHVKEPGEEYYPWPHGNGRPPGLRGYTYGTVSCRMNYFFLN